MNDSTTVGNDTSFSWGNVLGTVTGLATTGAQVYSTVTGKTPAPQKTAVQTATSSSKTLYYIGGAAVALLVGVLIFMRRGR